MRKTTIFIWLLCAACSNEAVNKNEGEAESAGEAESEVIEEQPNQSVEPEESRAKSYVVPSGFDFSSIDFDDLRLPVVDPETSVNILTPGSYHNDEVPFGSQDMQWMGLFKSSEAYYLKEASVIVEKAEDSMVDAEGQKTGWEVSVANPDKCILLISGIDLEEGTVPELSIENKAPIPGDTIDFSFSSIQGRFYVDGIKEQVSEDWYMVFNYKLIIETMKGDESITQIIVATPSFDDAMVNIIWAGDLDEDGKIDLIVDTSNHYNMMRLTLFLSSKAKSGSVLECVAIHTGVGC